MAGPTIRENPLTTRPFQARAIGRDPGISGQGIMASGPWKGRINRSKTWPHPNSAAAPQTELANGAPSRQGRNRTARLGGYLPFGEAQQWVSAAGSLLMA